ncbi:MAG: lipoate--protein ligase [Clostridia bacterium]|nr:lipoate--protein ligase [Clostridia bacterium]
MRLSVYNSPFTNIYRNLAIECYLANTYICGLTVYLWSNDNTVVIGKHQLAGKECDYATLNADNGHLARRLSGGGAVYHDINNLCYTFIYDKTVLSTHDTYPIILNALNKLGLNAQLTGRNDIELSGKKISGNAYYTRGNTQVHHGTLLISTDIERMQRYLTVDKRKLIGHGVQSVRSRVGNLIEFDSSITKQVLCHAIMSSLEQLYGNDITLPTIDEQYIAEQESFLHSPEWLYSFETYDNSVTGQFPWGQAEVRYTLVNGIITQLVIYTDCLEVQIIDDVKQNLVGKSLYVTPNLPNSITAEIYHLCQQNN